jgi:hypothetical protein
VNQQAVDPDSARNHARDILRDRRFRSDPAPRPFRGPLQWLGDRMAPIGRFFERVANSVPWYIWIALAIAATALIARWIIARSRRAAGGRSRTRAGAPEVLEDPAALEREADDAERRGDLDRAVRLRFRAGLLRLGARGVVDYRPSLTTTEVRSRLESARFDRLAKRFDEVAYGDAHAEPPDVETARSEWPRVVHDADRTAGTAGSGRR